MNANCNPVLLKLRRGALVLLAVVLNVQLPCAAKSRPRELQAAEVESIRFPADNHVPLKVIVSEYASDRFIADLVKIVDDIHKADKLTDERDQFKVQVIGRPADPKTTLARLQNLQKLVPADVLAERCEFDVPKKKKWSSVDPADRWMRDWGVLGTVKTTADRRSRLLVFDSNRGRGLEGLASMLAREWNGRVLKNPSEWGNDYGGNILPTPENVLAVGNTTTAPLRQLFENKGYKGRVAVLDAEWLTVGHVDEFLSVIPDPKGPTGYSYVKADPRLALRLVKEAPVAQLNAIEDDEYRGMMLKVRDYLNPTAQAAAADPLRKNMALYLSRMNHSGNPTRAARTIYRTILDEAKAIKQQDPIAQFILQNIEIGTKVDRNLANLCGVTSRGREVPQGTTHCLISYPQLYKESTKFFCEGTFGACFPNTVNQLVLRNHAVTPDPKIPLFRDYISKICEEHGVTAHFIDDRDYFPLLGDVHCGTNVLRHPERVTVAPKYSSATSATSSVAQSKPRNK